MYSLGTNIQQFSVLLCRHSFLNSSVSFQCSLRSFNDRKMIRRPLKKFKPTTSMKELEEFEEEDLYQSKLSQARKVAGFSHELVTKRSKKTQPTKLAASTKKIETGRNCNFLIIYNVNQFRHFCTYKIIVAPSFLVILKTFLIIILT